MSRRAAGLAAGLLLVRGAGRPSAGDTTTVLAPYLRARDEGRTDAVSGEVFAEPRSPHRVALSLRRCLRAAPALRVRFRGGAGPDPRSGFASRRSPTWRPAGRLRAAREAYEHELLFAGGGELIRGEVSDAGEATSLRGGAGR